ncbi:MAG TPA: ABC transporter [Cytophagales bacterium]|nr:ABC transporter [Cytophagales bacterium]HAP62575.1 ABC transporter [Cytophagales bacterium]
MSLVENFREGITSIKANMLRSVLTAAIIAIGIMALVGMLTAVEGIQQTIDTELSSLGAGSFDIDSKSYRGGSREGKAEKRHPKVTYREYRDFMERYKYPGTTQSLHTWVTGGAEVKFGSEKTDPRMTIRGGDENYILMEGLNLIEGRNFSNSELQYGVNVAIIGNEIATTLFPGSDSPLNQSITVYGSRYKVVGVLEEEGGFGPDGGPDRTLIIPVEAARKLEGRKGSGLWFTLSVILDASTTPTEMEVAMEEARGLFRTVRQDPLGEEDSFELERQESLSEGLEEATGYLRIGGFGIGFITLLGASIGLMNIMLVSVTERTREIGVRKALGATPTKIRQQFLIEAIVVCLLGGMGGIFLGLVVGNVISVSVLTTAFTLPVVWIAVGLAVCVTVGVLAGLIPAIKASRLDPIEALRYE